MPSRIGFKKSRNGCIRCKVRKVKCDEQRPVCGWCRQRSLQCEYVGTGHLSQQRPSTTSQSSSSDTAISTNDQPSSPTPPLPSGKSSQRRLLELSLLHYYVITVAPTFPYVDEELGLSIHADMIPQEAFRNPCLLNAMYTFALLHLHTETKLMRKERSRSAELIESLSISLLKSDSDGTDDTATARSKSQPELLTLHQDYLDHALSDQRHAIANINHENADAVCLTSILIGMTALVHASNSDSSSKNTTYTFPLQWFHLCRSFTACLNVARPLLTSKSATRKMTGAYERNPSSGLPPASSSKFHYLLAFQSSTGPEPIDLETTKAYERALSCVEIVHQQILTDEPWKSRGRQILAFPNIVSDLFVKFVEEARPRALVILAHLLAMSKTLDSRWWIFRGVAHFHVNEIAGIIPQEWQWTLTWPLQFLKEGVP